LRSPLAGEAAPAAPLRFLAAGLAAAALAVAPAPAEAGVVLVQPEVKNFVKDKPAAAKPAAAKQAAPAAKKEESASTGAGFESFRPLVLPLSLVAVVGAGAAATKADPEFAELLRGEWSAKDSNIVGVGYETAPGLKDTPFFGGSNTNGALPKKVRWPASRRQRGATSVWTSPRSPTSLQAAAPCRALCEARGCFPHTACRLAPRR
jgi:hypothetical protein